MNETPTLPIAETFTSIHGEGRYAGTRMTFFRLAGCTVGKSTPRRSDFPILPQGDINAFTCTAFDGRTFPCDTDYRKTSDLTVQQLLREIPKGVKHICITGGEPFMHIAKLTHLIDELRKRDLIVHFETSGTIMPPDYLLDYGYYIACSPKAGYLTEFLEKGFAGEIRLMVDRNFFLLGALRLLQHVPEGDCQIYLAPLSLPTDINRIDPFSMQKCLELMELPEFRKARISIQMHKILNVR